MEDCEQDLLGEVILSRKMKNGSVLKTCRFLIIAALGIGMGRRVHEVVQERFAKQRIQSVRDRYVPDSV